MEKSHELEHSQEAEVTDDEMPYLSEEPPKQEGDADQTVLRVRRETASESVEGLNPYRTPREGSMKTVAILDCETTGTNPETDRVIEVAVTLYDLECATPIRSYASLIQHDSNAAEHINNISVLALLHSPPAAYVWEQVCSEYLDDAEAIIAHNATFDQGFVMAELIRLDTFVPKVPWVCSMLDLKWPRQTKERSNLVALALAHGLGVAHAHRAAADVELISRLFTRAHDLGEDLQAMMAYGLRPKVNVCAKVSFADKDKAKNQGFVWDGVTKLWTKRMTLEDAEKLAFPWCQI